MSIHILNILCIEGCRRTLSCMTIALGLSLSWIGESTAQDPLPCVISEHGIGPVAIGMTFNAAKAALPDAVFQRTSDGDGAALVGISRGKIDLMMVQADEDDPAAPINWSRRIRFIETFHSACRTVGGVHPGMLVRDAQLRLGRVTEIMQSEIESREYVRFAKQPPHLLFRLDYSGVFSPGARRTTRFGPGASILSVAVVEPESSKPY